MLLRAIAVFSSHLCQAPGPHAHRRAHGALSQIQLNLVACTSEVPPPFPPSPLSMQLSACMGGACVPSVDAPALVPLVPRLFLCQPMLFPAGSARPNRSLFRLPALAHARPPRTPTARPWFRTPARPHACPCFHPPSPSPSESLSFPALFPCLPCLNSA